MRTRKGLFLSLVFAGVYAIWFPALPVVGQEAVQETEPQTANPQAAEPQVTEPQASEPETAEPKAQDLNVVPPRAYESGMVIVTAETAEVREGPSPRSEVITVVEKGEIFEKAGRTKGWYYIKLGENAFGWVSGRAIRRYRGSESPSPYVERYAEPDVGPYAEGYYPYYPYYPEPYYSYPYYWGEPYYWGGYYYGYDTHRRRDYYYNDYRYRARPRVEPYRSAPRVYNQHRNNNVYRGYAPAPPRPGPPARSFTPDHRPAPPAPFRRR